MDNTFTWSFLASTAKPYIKVVACPKKELMDFLASKPVAVKPHGIFVGVIDGGKAATKAGFFKQMVRTFDLPDYFGMNWDAFDDSGTEFGILADHFVMVITDAENFLTEKPFFQRKPRYGKPEDDLKIFCSIIEPELVWWNSEDAKKHNYALHLILHCEPEQETKLLARLQEAGFKL